MSAAVIVAANIILRSVPSWEQHFFSCSQAFPLLALARKNSPKLSNICSSTSGILVQHRGSLHTRRHQRNERRTLLKRWSTQNEEGNPATAAFNQKKKKKTQQKTVWDLAHSPLRPPGCQCVLEAKIEIPDTPVVNFAHASPAVEQDLL